MQEQAFSVKGGLLWFHHVLIAAVEMSKSYQVYCLRPALNAVLRWLIMLNRYDCTLGIWN
jgi:hypothetical protein